MERPLCTYAGVDLNGTSLESIKGIILFKTIMLLTTLDGEVDIGDPRRPVLVQPTHDIPPPLVRRGRGPRR